MMNSRKLVLRSLVFAAMVSTLAVCSADTPAAPQPGAQPNAALLGDLTGTVDNLLKPLSCATPGYGSVTKTIGTAGGSLSVGPHKFVIPPNALSKSTAITMSAPKGNYIEVKFQPEGLVFRTETALTMSYRDCGILVLNPKVTYVDDNHNILEVVLSVPNLLGKTVTGKVKHFSGYAVSE